MDTTETPTGNGENDVDLSKIEAMVTPEQEHSASVARKRRTITRKRSTSGGKARSKTPMRVSRGDGTSSSEEDDDAPPAADGRRGERVSRNGDHPKEEKDNANETEAQTPMDITKKPSVDPTSEGTLQLISKSEIKQTEEPTKKLTADEPQRRTRPKITSNIEPNQELQRRVRPRAKTSTDLDSSGQSQDEPVKRIRPRLSKNHKEEVLRRVRAKSLPRDDVSKEGGIKHGASEEESKRESREVRRREPREELSTREPEEESKRESKEIRRREPREELSKRETEEEFKRASREVRRRENREELSRREPKDEISRREPRVESSRHEAVEEPSRRDPREEPSRREPREEISRREHREEIFRREPREETLKSKAREEISRYEPREEVSTREPREEVPRHESREDISRRDTNGALTRNLREDAARSETNGASKRNSREEAARSETNGASKRNSREEAERSETNGASKRNSREEAARSEINGALKRNSKEEAARSDESTNHKTKEEASISEPNKLKTKPRKIESATNSERHSNISDSSSISMERRGSLPKNFEEKMQKLDKMVSDNTKDLMNLFHRAKTTVEEKGKELRRRKFHKTDQKRSQSTPKQLTEDEVMESFKKAQAATAEREKERIRSLSARRYSSGSEKSQSPEPMRPARKPYRPVVQELLKQKKAEKQLKNRIKSNKIIEILDPKTSKVIATKEMGLVAKIKFFDIFRIFRQFGPRQIMREYSKYKRDMSDEYKQITNQRRKCINHLIILIIFCGIGGFIFKFTEGSFENFYKCGVKRVKRDFIDLLWIKSHNMREEDWKSLARNKLRVFEDELHTAHEAGIHSYSGQKSWSFLNGIVYCLTVVTTIGYGHLYPTTKTGQALTIVYSLIGIPLFLIILTDFGKLFTRCIKFLWSFVRRLYYTGNCRSMRKTSQVQEIFKGAQMVYELATFRRPSMFDPNMNKNASPGDSTEQNTTAPPTPAISNYEIDDEFNLPISVAILLLVLYILLGALLFGIWEGWDFFASFYFVFISMSTIGFGDYVPRHPIFMIVSIVYLVFGLALMSMCINVVQVKLSDTFNQASAKIGATIGLGVAPEDGTIKPVPPKNVEMPQVHGSITDINSIKSGEVIGPNTSRV